MKQVFVLLDKTANVYCVTTDPESADQWLTFDDDFGVVECELDDYTMFNAVSDEVDEIEGMV